MSIIQIAPKQFHLKGKNFSYVFGADRFEYLCHKYYGAPISDDADLGYFYRSHVYNDYTAHIPGVRDRFSSIYPEYPVANYGEFRDYAICVEDSRGCRVTDLHYEGFEILSEKPAIKSGIPTSRGGETLVISLWDEVLSLRVKLYYTVYEEENIITRRAEIENCGKEPVKLLRALSMSLDFFDHDFNILTLRGGHHEERHECLTPANYGKVSVGNCRGNSSHQNSPFIALLRPNVTEETGDVFACSLMYSGSHYECAEVDQYGKTRMMAGIQPETFTWKLESGERFETPEAILCYSDEGLGKMSRSYHDFYRNYVINPNFVYRPRPVVLNSWEGMHFNFDNKRLLSAIDAVKGSEIDTFVLDDGWFGARNNDKAGLGDWFVNTEKLPGGLKEISDHCHEAGMNFGLWIEPEMINPDSDLYRAHPDWIISAPDRKPILSRNQCILDLTRRDVLDHIKSAMYRVISESGANYIKWDCNRHMTENWSHLLPADQQGEVQHRYILGVYELATYLTESFPDILFEGCSGGGGRFDGAMLKFFPQYWTSDNTDANDRTEIQYGTGLCFPLSTHSCHVSASPNIRNGRSTSVRARTNIARQGILGYEFDPLRVSEEELSTIAENIKKYRATERLVLEGDLYRRENRLHSNFMSQTVVSKDKKQAMMVFYQALNPHNSDLIARAAGLDPDRHYRIEELDTVLSGSVLCNVGIYLERMPGDFDAVLFTLTAVD
ncbi:MAG: alpha-galactosidase [Clostridia bacterium]|nr:alpha-galactosidase [Clostridia bacterium]